MLFFQAEDGIRDYKVTGVQTCALPICWHGRLPSQSDRCRNAPPQRASSPPRSRDRKSTRLNSSHLVISYAVFCLKKKKTPYHRLTLVRFNRRHATAHVQVRAFRSAQASAE